MRLTFCGKEKGHILMMVLSTPPLKVKTRYLFLCRRGVSDYCYSSWAGIAWPCWTILINLGIIAFTTSSGFRGRSFS